MTPHRQRRLMLGAWLFGVASGALATGLIRVPLGIAGIGSTALVVHIGLGAALSMLGLWWLQRASARAPSLPAGARSAKVERMWPASAVIATLVLGFLAWRSLSPATVAMHAAVAALTTAALAGAGWAPDYRAIRPPAPKPRRSWKATVASAGFLLIGAQVVLGALLRHHLVSLSWHLVVAGLSALAILAPAVAIAQDSTSTRAEKRASTWAINSVLAQAGLGVAILGMMMTGSASAGAWLIATVLHVVVGSATLLAARTMARTLREPAVNSADVDGGS